MATQQKGKKSLNLTGLSGRTYDLDKIESENRINSERELVIHVHEYHKGENPNPSNLQVGQIWISKLVE